MHDSPDKEAQPITHTPSLADASTSLNSQKVLEMLGIKMSSTLIGKNCL